MLGDPFVLAVILKSVIVNESTYMNSHYVLLYVILLYQHFHSICNAFVLNLPLFSETNNACATTSDYRIHDAVSLQAKYKSMKTR